MDYIMKQLLKDYEIKRNQAILDAENRKRDLLSVNPKLSEIDNELAKLSIETTQAVLNSKDTLEHKKLLDDLKKKSNSLMKEKNKFIKELVKDSNYLKPHFECKTCKDTGYAQKDGNLEICACLKQKIFDSYYNKSNARKLEEREFFKIQFQSFFQRKKCGSLQIQAFSKRKHGNY